MNILRIVKIFFVLLLPSCGFFSQDKHIDSITTTQAIFLDSNEKIVHFTVDGIVPDFREVLKQKLKDDGINVTQNVNSATILLKVRTKFHGKNLIKNYENIVKNDISFENIEQLPKHEKEISVYKKTTIDNIIEDPSGIILGFVAGIVSGSPIVGAPIGMVVGAGVNLGVDHFFARDEFLTVFEVEVLEKMKKPIWFNEKKIHKTDEYGVRKYDFSQETFWKTHKTRIIVRSKNQDIKMEEVASRITSFVI